MSGHLCPDCQVCPSCGRSAWCEGDRILAIPCSHLGYCGDCNGAECAECQAGIEAEIAADLATTFAHFGGDPFRNPNAADDADPLGPLAAESRAVTDAFWRGVGDRSGTTPKDAS